MAGDVSPVAMFGPQKGHFGQSGPQNGPPSGQTATYRKTKVIQSYLRMWGTYDPIESELSDPKKLGLYGCSVKKGDFGGKKGPKKGLHRLNRGQICKTKRCVLLQYHLWDQRKTIKLFQKSNSENWKTYRWRAELTHCADWVRDLFET